MDGSQELLRRAIEEVKWEEVKSHIRADERAYSKAWFIHQLMSKNKVVGQMITLLWT